MYVKKYNMKTNTNGDDMNQFNFKYSIQLAFFLIHALVWSLSMNHLKRTTSDSRQIGFVAGMEGGVRYNMNLRYIAIFKL